MATGGCRRLLVAVGGYWWLQSATGGCRWLLTALTVRQNKYGLQTLEVLEVSKRHGGLYRCQATNQQGSASCEATVLIEGTTVTVHVTVRVTVALSL